jgi:DNA-binding MarR family transcriptional regulator
LLYPTRKPFRRLDPAALQVLIAVELLGQPSATAIARRLELELSSVSGALRALREKGYLRVVEDPDRRRRPHETTRQGSALVGEFGREVRRRRTQQRRQENRQS